MLYVIALAAAGALSPRLYAQVNPPTPRAPIFGPQPARIQTLVTLGSPAEERLRLAHLVGNAATDGFLIRSPASLSRHLELRDGGFNWAVLAPELRSTWNSDIPYSLNDGSLWAGRGLSTLVMAGLRAGLGPVSLTIAPQVSHSQNLYFDPLPGTVYEKREDLSLFSSFWHIPPRSSIDLPYRFGDQPYTIVDFGQSALVVGDRRVKGGIASENQWWGPGIHNSIVMSNNAPGFPHLFVRTGEPVRTRLGDLEAKWIIGGLTESIFFADQGEVNPRSLSGAVLSYRPVWDPHLTLGGSRVVYSNAGRTSQVLRQAFDVFSKWERRDSVGDLDWARRTDQIFSLFARWVFPPSGFEVYGEWARHELPVSIRDLLTAPQHSQGYTLGLQWARPLSRGTLRLQAEATSLEQSTTFKQRPLDTFYTSRAVHQGYTHRGQVIGAAIGPGSSSQRIGLDLFGENWHAGIFGARIRWEADALYLSRSPTPWRLERSFHAFDASLLGGLRGAYRSSFFDVGIELSTSQRYNFLFQNPDLGWGPDGAVDVQNHTLKLFVTTLGPFR